MIGPRPVTAGGSRQRGTQRQAKILAPQVCKDQRRLDRHVCGNSAVLPGFMEDPSPGASAPLSLRVACSEYSETGSDPAFCRPSSTQTNWPGSPGGVVLLCGVDKAGD